MDEGDGKHLRETEAWAARTSTGAGASGQRRAILFTAMANGRFRMPTLSNPDAAREG